VSRWKLLGRILPTGLVTVNCADVQTLQTTHPPCVQICTRSFPSVRIPLGWRYWQVICSRFQHEASCHWLAAHAEHNLFSGQCLNVSYDCVEVWCVPSAMCKYSAWHHSVIKCFATSLHVFMSPYSAFHRLGISWLCLHISFLMV